MYMFPISFKNLKLIKFVNKYVNKNHHIIFKWDSVKISWEVAESLQGYLAVRFTHFTTCFAGFLGISELLTPNSAAFSVQWSRNEEEVRFSRGPEASTSG